jgi:hypothetical protein
MIQRKAESQERGRSHGAGEAQVPFGSNCVRLSPCEWLFVGIIIFVVFFSGPRLWQWIEKFEPGADYRLPYKSGNDYWLYERYCRWACSKYDVLVIGDSVVWGHYVSKENTLSHYLNEAAARDRFANLGVDGIHPVALAGLLRYYGRDISNKKVILHFNPLWMTSPKHDLQIEKEFHFNHPKLAPQFAPKIPCYRASYARRVSNVMERYVSLLSWTNHLRISYFENMDIPTWTLEHPYENPADAVTLQLPESDSFHPSDHVSWSEKGITKQDFPWVELETSLQWKFFRRSVAMLKARANRVFVIVGPFNEHMLSGQSIGIYQNMKDEIELWLQQSNIPYYIPPPLPTELYRDASHPLSRGYATLAAQLFQNDSFQAAILDR